MLGSDDDEDEDEEGVREHCMVIFVARGSLAL
jgi:hypothetical protein